ncbi:MAG: MurR/RpiR family transcriptional regulator [Stellaceae bacterium]
MPVGTSDSFVGRIREQLGDLPPTERRLGEFLLDFPGELASYTASELARLANVSNATVTRFVKRLGYASYDVARRHVRAEKAGGAALFLATPVDGHAGDPLDAHRRQSQHNIEATFSHLSNAIVDDLANAIVAAPQVWIFGYRSSRSFATYLRWQIIQVAAQTHVVPGAGETLGEYLPTIARGDCAIVFGLNRRVAGLAAMLDEVIAAGARVAYITDQPRPPTAPPEWVVRCETTGPGPLYDHSAVMALCDLIATRVLQLAGRSGRRRLTAIEVAHDTFAEIEK